MIFDFVHVAFLMDLADGSKSTSLHSLLLSCDDSLDKELIEFTDVVGKSVSAIVPEALLLNMISAAEG